MPIIPVIISLMAGLLIVDFGSQTAHLIGRRFRQMDIAVEYCDPEDALKKIHSVKPQGLVLSGGPSSVYEPNAPTISAKVFSSGIPTLGICYGWQLMAHKLGGKVERQSPEYGPEQLHIPPSDSLFKDISKTTQVYMSHGDSVIKLPPNFKNLASTSNTAHAAVVNKAQNLYGVQFHPEVTHTPEGIKMLANFAQICGLTIDTASLNPQVLIDKIKNTVGDRKVICGVSGGVDSTVAAFLIAKAIGKNLIPVYVDSGLMRAGTTDSVRAIFSELVHADLVIVKAQTRFMQALKGLTDPEQKRKAIGKLYVDLFQEQALNHRDAAFLAQGTIYSDVIESKGSKNASQIKSHHNVGGLPKSLKLQLLEPMREYYKDEVRAIGRLAGLPEEIVSQQPFPGPGYAIRIRGEVTAKRLEQVKLADQIVIEEMKKSGLWSKAFQCFALLTGAQSTAVKGDAKVFAEVVGIRAYESDDVMTSDWLYLPREVLQKMSSRIVNEVPNVSRVVYDITTKPPATMEWE